MSTLREPGLGPIVGHTTTTSCRLWIRAADPDDKDGEFAANRRTIGVAAIMAVDGVEVAPESAVVHYFRLHREYDRTGTINVGASNGLIPRANPPKLKPDTEYRVRLGTLTLDDPLADDETLTDADLIARLPNPKVWFGNLTRLDPAATEADFRTFRRATTGGTDELSFIVGSCRYPGLGFSAKRADAIFKAVLEEVGGRDARRTADFVLMAGDQIYADKFNRFIPVGLADTFKEFQERYVNALGSPHMRRLLRRIPSYMILDDHEIEDNWTQDRITKDQGRRLFNLAIGAYMSYQWSHGPRTYGNRLFYQFDSGGYPFFVLDTRTQRFMDDVSNSLVDNHLLGRPSLDPDEPSQLGVLVDWLKKQPKKIPKFIVSSSVFAPNPMTAREGRKSEDDPVQEVRWKEKSDSWPAFPTTRRALLKTIIDNQIQNVVFVSGDIHCSNVAELRFSGSAAAEKLKAFSITSSAFYWPFPFADGSPSDYVHDSTDEEQLDTFAIDTKHTMNYVASQFTQEDNFCRIDLDRNSATLQVRVYGTDGEPVRKSSWFRPNGPVIESNLQLEPWN